MADRKYGRHIVQCPQEVSFCSGCKGCEIVCSLLHDGVSSPSCSRIMVKTGTHSLVSVILTCRHCADHPCYNACPKKDSAMRVDENGIVYINERECVGCKLCVKNCAFDPPRINFVNSGDKAKRKAKKCDLCRTREQGPACVEYCQVACISVSD